MSQHLSVPPAERPAPSRAAACACEIVFVALVPIVVPGIASGSFPDPTWLLGIYDGADGDDVVILIGNLAAANVTSDGHITSLPWKRDGVRDLEPLGVERPRAGSLARGPPPAWPCARVAARAVPPAPCHRPPSIRSVLREAVRSCPPLRPRDRRGQRLFYVLTAFGSGEFSVSDPFATYRECRNAVEALAILHQREASNLEIGFTACYPCPPDEQEEEE